MSTNKRAIIRYRTLDVCFSSKYRKFFIDDLMERCSEVLTEHIGKPTTVSRRQIFDDINFMKSEAGYNAPIESYKEGKKVYYRYDDEHFSIEKSPINAEELEQIKDALEVFGRIKGLPNFEWMAELETKLRDSIDNSENGFISFDHNPFLKGLEHLQELYNYIKHQLVLTITYQSFKMDTPADFIIHPYHLKQYNNRWFLFGLNDELDKIQNLALDRIIKMDTTQQSFKECTVDFEEYFEDIVGVTNNIDEEPVKVELYIDTSLLPYVKSKPLHGSQKLKGNLLTLNVKLNYELESLLLSFGENITILKPEELKIQIHNRLNGNLKNYKQ